MFISYEFILFLLVLFAVYYVIPKRFQWILLLIANFLFYYSAGAFYPLFILATSVTVWFAGVCIDRQEGQWQSYQAEIKAGKIEKPSRDEKKAVKAKIGGKKKRIMLVCLLFNLGILAVLRSLSPVIMTTLWIPRLFSCRMTSGASSLRGSSMQITAASLPSIAIYRREYSSGS